MSRQLFAILVAIPLVACGTDSSGAESNKPPPAAPGPIERALTPEAPTAPSAEPPTAANTPVPSIAPVAQRVAVPNRARAPLARRAAPTSAPARRAPAVPSRATEASSTQPASASRVSLARVRVTAEIANREPVAGPITSSAERAFLFVEARNEGTEPVELSVEWVGPDGVVGRPVALEVPPARRWRTWASTRRVHRRPGTYQARIRLGDRVLATEAFEVVTPDEGAAAS